MLHKVAVGLLWALDLFHLALIIHAVYHYMVTGWGRSEGIEDIVWSIKARYLESHVAFLSNLIWLKQLQVLINVVIILIVQSLYAFRVWLRTCFVFSTSLSNVAILPSWYPTSPSLRFPIFLFISEQKDTLLMLSL